MKTPSKFLIPVLILLLGAPACHDDGLDVHGCPTTYAGPWSAYDLRLAHQDPSQCPVFIPAPGTWLSTGATVVDGGIAPEFYRSQLTVYNANDVYLEGDEETFREDVDSRWISPIDVDYGAGTADLRPDKAYYDLTLRSGGSGPSAVTTISYTDRVVASISGPSIVEPGATYTWSAFITSGQAPFEYRWYVDWDLVGSDASYTGPAPGDTTLIRLDVTDARGEVDSHTKRVVVDYCDGARVC